MQEVTNGEGEESTDCTDFTDWSVGEMDARQGWRMVPGNDSLHGEHERTGEVVKAGEVG